MASNSSLITSSSLTTRSLSQRMIQDFSNASNTRYYWGYGERVLPCTSDAGACAYLDIIYASHDASMLYTGIFWALISGTLFLWALIRWCSPFASRATVDGLALALPLETEKQTRNSRPRFLHRLTTTVSTLRRKYLLPSSLQWLFGPVPRLQVLILFILVSYLTIFTFTGMLYSVWFSPVQTSPGSTNTRTTLGPWADRIGVWAYALTPLSILLSSRESLLSLITGIPYSSFLFLHRWTGHIIFLQSILHTLGWVVVEAKLYQPQPRVWDTLMTNAYVQWGFGALGLLTLLWVGSLGWVIRNVSGYEFFRKSHSVLAMVYIGGVIMHWKLLQCFLVPGIVLWFVDRFGRLVRTALLHYHVDSSTTTSPDPNTAASWWPFRSCTAHAQLWPDAKNGDVYRLDFTHAMAPWQVGQHFFLCFPEGSVWQSHPMTPLSRPVPQKDGGLRHSYVIRAQRGETRKIARVIQGKIERGDAEVTTPVVLQGPYGEDILSGVGRDTNVLCVAGGTGVTYVLPVLLRLGMERMGERRVELVWAVRRTEDVNWVREEVEELLRVGIRCRVFVTVGQDRAESIDPSSNNSAEKDLPVSTPREVGEGEIEWFDGRPDVSAVTREFVDATVRGPTTVFASGPHGMLGDLRSAVARRNNGARVWRGEERWDVNLVCDER